MKLNLIAYEILLATLILAACGSDSGTDSGKESSSGKEPSESKTQYELFDDLPNCTSTREGEIAEILDDGEYYICKSKKWEEYANTELKSYPTEDDMPNCSAKNENSLAFVEADSVVQVCKDSRWETLGHPYANEDSLPNCSKKRDGEKAYLMEEDEVQVCKDGVWSATGEMPTSSNASKSDDGGDKPKSDDAGTKTKSSSSQESTSDGGDEIDSSSSKSVNTSTSIAPGVTEGTFTDPRDGQKYRTVKIGNQEWFAQNLNYDTGDDKSRCPLDIASYCKRYGRLYTDVSSYRSYRPDGNCPKGWHVPYETEWDELIDYVSHNNDGENVGKSLKASSGWFEVGFTVIDNNYGERVAVATGDDSFRFSALPAGSCWNSGGCYSNDDAHFLSRDGESYKLTFDSDYIERGDYLSGYLSIRCIKSEPIEIDPMPESVVAYGIEITSENLTHDGSDIFMEYDAAYACPEGWRLPSDNEAHMVIGYVVGECTGGICTDFGMYTSTGYYGAQAFVKSGHVRCVKE